MKTLVTSIAMGACAAAAIAATPVAAQYQQRVSNDMSRCAPGKGAAALVTITNISESKGKLRVQAYNGTKSDWLEKGRWLNRMEVAARKGTMKVCVPLPGPGTYAIAVRHDLNANGKTDLRSDGGGMSNNPSINVFNLGKPSYTQTRFSVDGSAKPITIQMRYF